jgi:hypothetical protein
MEYVVHEWDIYPNGDWDTFRLPDGGEILASEWRGANRLQIAIAVPTGESKQCIAETKDGEQCQNSAMDGKAVCGTHHDRFER